MTLLHFFIRRADIWCLLLGLLCFVLIGVRYCLVVLNFFVAICYAAICYLVFNLLFIIVVEDRESDGQLDFQDLLRLIMATPTIWTYRLLKRLPAF